MTTNIEQANKDIASAQGFLKAAEKRLQEAENPDPVPIRLFKSDGSYSIKSWENRFGGVIQIYLDGVKDDNPRYLGNGITSDLIKAGWYVESIDTSDKDNIILRVEKVCDA